MTVQIKELAQYFSDDNNRKAIIQLINENGTETLQVHCYTNMEMGRKEHSIMIARTMAQASHIAEDFVYGVLRG
jgi:hypothetical protein